MLSVLLVGAPIVIAEMALGRQAGGDAATAFERAAPRSHWPLAGWLGIAGSCLILSYYAVIAGWALKYLAGGVLGTLWRAAGTDYGGYFARFIANPGEPPGENLHEGVGKRADHGSERTSVLATFSVSAAPGRNMISTPTKPMTTALIRLMPTCSPRNGIERTVMKRGRREEQRGRIGEGDGRQRGEEAHVRYDDQQPAQEVQPRPVGAQDPETALAGGRRLRRSSLLPQIPLPGPSVATVKAPVPNWLWISRPSEPNLLKSPRRRRSILIAKPCVFCYFP